MIRAKDMAATHKAAFANSRPWGEAEFSGLLASDGCFASGDARCFAVVRVVLDEAELLTIATHPGFSRQGLARVQMANWQKMARQRGATRAFLEVAADNNAAITLYLASGFAANGLRPRYYRRGDGAKVDAVLMARDLS